MTTFRSSISAPRPLAPAQPVRVSTPLPQIKPPPPIRFTPPAPLARPDPNKAAAIAKGMAGVVDVVVDQFAITVVLAEDSFAVKAAVMQKVMKESPGVFVNFTVQPQPNPAAAEEAVKGVKGVVSTVRTGNSLVVYIESDSAAVKGAVQAEVTRLAKGMSVRFEVVGKPLTAEEEQARDAVLALEGVNGVEVKDGQMTVWLTRDEPEIKRTILSTVQEIKRMPVFFRTGWGGTTRPGSSRVDQARDAVARIQGVDRAVVERDNSITVYLRNDTEYVRRQVRQAVSSYSPGTYVTFNVGGTTPPPPPIDPPTSPQARARRALERFSNVSRVDEGPDGLTVTLREDSSVTKREVLEAVDRLAPGTPVEFRVSR